jgi:anthranilate phosphoribosyltransferase
MNPQPVILTAALVTLASTTGSDLRAGNPLDPKKIVGGFLAMTVCSVIAEVDSELGVGLAIAIAGTAFVEYGLPTLNGTTVTKNSQPLTAKQTTANRNTVNSTKKIAGEPTSSSSFPYGIITNLTSKG